MNIEKKMRNLKVKGKLNLYRSFVIAVVLIMGIVAIGLSIVVFGNVKAITETWSPSLYYVQRMNTLTSDYRLKQYGHLVSKDEAGMKSYDNEMLEVDAQINDVIAKFESLITTEQERKLYENIVVKWDSYKQQSSEVIELSRKNETDKGGELLVGEAYDTYKDFGASFNELLVFEQEQLDIASNTVKIAFLIMFAVIAAVVVVAAFTATKLGNVVIKLITEPVGQIAEAAERLSKGDMSAGQLLTYEAEDELGIVAKALQSAMQTLDDYIDEISSNLREIAKGDLTKNSDDITEFLGDFSSIKESFVYILKRFNATLTEIQNTSDQVASNSGNIADSSRSLSEGAADQASAIEELTATVATVAGLADESAKSTQIAVNNIAKSVKKAESEKEKMAELTEEMKRITEISKEIENIITAIEDIASQTNLLSLNASIEAARAGDAGKGFAVVADQIGKLAADSAQSAINTRELIGKTLEEIEKGNSITASTSEAFDKVIEEMKMFADVAQQTNDNVRDQAQALEQIEQGIEQISVVMQNTAAASEESTAISDNLSEEAVALDGLVKKFKLF